MCRMIIFRGYCNCCGSAQTWVDLTQELNCLDAKNLGWFGGCQRGILVEEHSFNQECSICHEEDEGVGIDDNYTILFQQTSHTQSSLGKRSSTEDQQGTSSSSGSAHKRQRTWVCIIYNGVTFQFCTLIIRSVAYRRIESILSLGWNGWSNGQGW